MVLDSSNSLGLKLRGLETAQEKKIAHENPHKQQRALGETLPTLNSRLLMAMHEKVIANSID